MGMNLWITKNVEGAVYVEGGVVGEGGDGRAEQWMEGVECRTRMAGRTRWSLASRGAG